MFQRAGDFFSIFFWTKRTVHLDIGLALPQALLLVHVGRHLPPLLAHLDVLLIRSLHCIYTRRTHPPARRRERESNSPCKQVWFGNHTQSWLSLHLPVTNQFLLSTSKWKVKERCCSNGKELLSRIQYWENMKVHASKSRTAGNSRRLSGLCQTGFGPLKNILSHFFLKLFRFYLLLASVLFKEYLKDIWSYIGEGFAANSCQNFETSVRMILGKDPARGSWDHLTSLNHSSRSSDVSKSPQCSLRPPLCWPFIKDRLRLRQMKWNVENLCFRFVWFKMRGSFKLLLVAVILGLSLAEVKVIPVFNLFYVYVLCARNNPFCLLVNWADHVFCWTRKRSPFL